MSDLKLFKLSSSSVTELEASQADLERSLQKLFESNLDNLLGVRFLESEFSTTHGGRMDTVGIDENNCPVIIEYKRGSHENVINQGLFYLDWLMDHQKDFEWLVLDKFGKDAAESVEWSAPRLICIANDFNKYDEHAVNQMDRNIALIRYKRFEGDLLLLEQLTSTVARSSSVSKAVSNAKRGQNKTVADYLAQADSKQSERYETLRDYMLSLGDDVELRTLKKYFAFRRIKNFACVEVHTRTKNLLVYVKVNPDEVLIEKGFTRDVRNIGHFGTGDLEITIGSDEDFDKAKPLLIKSYEAS